MRAILWRQRQGLLDNLFTSHHAEFLFQDSSRLPTDWAYCRPIVFRRTAMTPPQNPAGPFVPENNYDARRRAEFIAVIEHAPAALRVLVSNLNDGQLDTLYRNWTIRQIVHHLADSHVNCYIRFKWALTEDLPTIKPYDEGRWAALDDSRTGDIRVPLALLEGLHARWVQLLRSLSDEQFARSFFHPETNKTVSLNAALCSYAWHCRHHTAQIEWVCRQQGWRVVGEPGT